MLDKPDVKRTIASLIASDGGFRPAQDDILFISSQDNSGTAGLELIDELIDQDN